MAEHRMRLSEFTAMIRDGWTDDEIYRFMTHDLPRRLMGMEPARRPAVLGERPPVTGTRWDGLLAAMVEHLAELHGIPPPAWVDEPERFVQPTWIPIVGEFARLRDLAWVPAAFLRHGVVIDPRSLDGRGGERHAWAPGPRANP